MRGDKIMIYLDHASTTALCEPAKQAMVEHLDDYGNPSSSYEFARKSRQLIEDARERIAKCINAEPYEIYFTSGGSEANSWALSGYGDIITTNIEHHSVKGIHMFKADKDGLIDIDKVQNVFKNELDYFWFTPDVCSCMIINNELGTIQPVSEIAKIAHRYGVYFHVDATQAVGHIPVDVKAIGCDMLSASAHKFNGPKGVGILFIKEGAYNPPKLINGGKQERGIRSGTENILGIVAMAAALEDAVKNMEARSAHVELMRDVMLHKLMQIEGAHINGSMEYRVPSNINIRFDGVSGARLVTLASIYDICISSGSACNEGVATPSHVLKAIGLSDNEALSSIRITLGHDNTIEEIDEAAEIITQLVARIREENS
jgi:cysteine desulfurase